jgi:hypothetical protein
MSDPVDSDPAPDAGPKDEKTRSDTSDGLTRRAVLAGMTAAGVAGTTTGLGAGATFLDRERPAATYTAGALDLAICVETDEDDELCRPRRSARTATVDLGTLRERGDSGTASVRLRLPEDGRNNPARLWMRTNCPTDACGIERAVAFTLFYPADCDRFERGGRPVPGGRGTLCEVLDTFGSGVALNGVPGERGSLLRPGRDLCLGVRWELTEEVCATDRATVTFEFAARQARHANADPVWDPVDCGVDCDADCPDCPDGPGISWFALVTDADGGFLTTEDVAFTVSARNPEGEPVRVEWTVRGRGTPRVERATVKYGAPGGPVIANFPGGRSGSVTTLDDPDRRSTLVGRSGPNPALAGENSLRYEYDPRRGTTGPGDQWVTEDATLVFTDGAANATHRLSVPTERDLSVDTLVVEYDGGFDLSAVSRGSTVVAVSGRPDRVLDPEDFEVDAREDRVTFSFDRPPAVPAGNDFVVVYGPVEDPDANGPYGVTVTVDGSPSRRIEGRCPIRR